MHVVPPARFSIPAATAGVHGHLFRVHASRMSVLFLIWGAQIQKYTANILYLMEREKIVDGIQQCQRFSPHIAQVHLLWNDVNRFRLEGLVVQVP